MKMPGLVDAKGLGRLVGVATTAEQAADRHLACIAAVALSQFIEQTKIVFVDIPVGAAGRLDPRPAGPPGRGGKHQGQIVFSTGVQVLPENLLDGGALVRVVYKSGVDHVLVEFVSGPFQALDHGAFPQNARVVVEKGVDVDGVHGGSILVSKVVQSVSVSRWILYSACHNNIAKKEPQYKGLVTISIDI